MDRELFDHAIGEVPPSTVDVDGVIARGRRAAWVRRAANPWVATAAGVTAIAFGVAAAVLPGSSPGLITQGSAPPRTSSATAPPSTSPSMVVECDTRPAPPQVPPQEAAATAARLSSVLTAAAQTQLPAGTQLTANPTSEYPKGHPHGPLEFYYIGQPQEARGNGCAGGVSYYLAWATVVRSGVKGNLMALVSPPDPNSEPLACMTGTVEGAQFSCSMRTGPNGEAIMTYTLTQNGGGPTNYRVEVARRDGTGVLLDSANVGGDSKNGGRPSSSRPPLSHEQLITIALDPGLTAAAR